MRGLTILRNAFETARGSPTLGARWPSRFALPRLIVACGGEGELRNRRVLFSAPSISARGRQPEAEPFISGRQVFEAARVDA